jgi:hypothetical protein
MLENFLLVLFPVTEQRYKQKNCMSKPPALKVLDIAEDLGYSKRYVRMVLSGERTNENILKAGEIWDQKHSETKDAVRAIATENTQTELERIG